MDKYGVVLDDENEKIANLKGRPCPQCGSNKVNYNGLTPHCPQCGTEPWEKRDGATQDHRR